MLATNAPFRQYFDLDGSPLNGGKLYFGVVGEDSIASPAPIFWDAAGLVPAAQPVPTMNGYPVRNGSPTNVYIEGDYSTTAVNRLGQTVFYASNSADFDVSAMVNALEERLLDSSAASRGAGQVGYSYALSYADSTIGAELRLVGRAVSSIVALKALEKTENPRAFVLGYSAPHDGGGGQYWLDASDTTSADNGGTIIVATDGGRWKLVLTGPVSVKQFGAKGDFDGTTGTDDHAAIQACIDWVQANTDTGVHGSFSPSAGTGVVYFPQGSYGVTQELVVGYKLCILGEGQTEFTYGSRLYQRTANTHLFKFDPATGGGSFSIENMVLSSSAGVGTGDLVNVERSGPYINSQRYKNCTFAQPQNNSLTLTGDDIEISSCLFDVSQKSGNGIQLGTATGIASNVRIDNCDFFNITNYIVKLVNVSGLSWGSSNVVSQPNSTTKTLRIFDAISTAPVVAQDITITGGTFKGARTFFGGNGVTNVSISGANVTAGGIGAGEARHLIELTGNCSINLTGNFFRGTYDTMNFYNDSGAGTVLGLIGGNSFVNDGGAGDALSCTKFAGRLLPNYFTGFVAHQMSEKRNVSGIAPGTVASGATFGHTVTVPGATFGDTVTVGTVANSWVAQTGIDVVAFVSATNTARIEYRNPTGSGIAIATHTATLEVTR